MLGFGRGRRDTDDSPGEGQQPAAGRASGGWLARLRAGLRRTGGGLAGLFRGRSRIDTELLEELETRLLMADVGLEASQRIVAELERRPLAEGETPQQALREAMLGILRPCEAPLEPDPERRPFVILTVGVNGAGKTTTIGKLARRYRDQGLSVMLAAGDTFRAAAVEQLKVWGERCAVPVVSQPTGSDSASVVYDAHHSARARGIQVLIADTAGRLHTQSNLMQELAKIRRVLGKNDPDAPHEVLLVLDAGIGQNALVQAQQFRDAVGVTGLALTKLDGTAKGGVIFAIAERLGLPIRYVGVGESVEDLRPFSAEEFVDALLETGSEGGDSA